MSSPKKNNNSSSGTNKRTEEEEVKLYRCIPESFLLLPKWLRLTLGHLITIFITFTFLTIPFTLIVLVPPIWRIAPYCSTAWIAIVILSYFLPPLEVPIFRKVFQLWYEIFDFHHNLSPADIERCVKDGKSKQFIIGMHPHGIIPLQAFLWTAYADQYLRLDGTDYQPLYGFGAAADAVNCIPILRNVMYCLSAGSAAYKVLLNGLKDGISLPCNNAGRKPRHLYILPGGIAEIFSSQVGRHAIVFKDRRGLIRLSLETGAELIPCYVFGGTDFFHNLATTDNLLARLSRKYKMGLTWFWGKFGLPIPFAPKVTMCIGEPLAVDKWTGNDRIPDDIIDELHERYIKAINDLFNRYKVQAGYPNAELEVL